MEPLLVGAIGAMRRGWFKRTPVGASRGGSDEVGAFFGDRGWRSFRDVYIIGVGYGRASGSREDRS